jgi:hypothetical protein
MERGLHDRNADYMAHGPTAIIKRGHKELEEMGARLTLRLDRPLRLGGFSLQYTHWYRTSNETSCDAQVRYMHDKQLAGFFDIYTPALTHTASRPPA